MLSFQPIDRRSGLNRQTFAKVYLEPEKPVVFTDFMEQWPAKNKWTVEFFKKKYGHLSVPVFSANYSKPGKKYMEPDAIISFKSFLEQLESGPTDLRMFLYNIFRHAPELCNDFCTPTIMDGFIKSFPYMFFGGEGSIVAMHFDIDMSHVFLNQFHGRKRVILFPPEQSKNIYHQPFTVKSEVDILNPDYDRFPALKNAKGYECILYPGETIFMPRGYWHHITYLDGGYSISLRANDSLYTRARGLWNIATHYVVDKGMNRILGETWQNYKIAKAKERAEIGIDT